MDSKRRRKLHLDRSTVKRLTGPALARANGGTDWARSDLRYCMWSAVCNTEDCDDTRAVCDYTLVC